MTGKRMEEIGEWIMSKYEIPNKEYEKLTKAFNPIYFNADEWVQLAKKRWHEVHRCNRKASRWIYHAF